MGKRRTRKNTIELLKQRLAVSISTMALKNHEQYSHLGPQFHDFCFSYKQVARHVLSNASISLLQLHLYWS